MHRFTHVWPVQTCGLLSPLDMILAEFESYLAIWPDKIFQVYRLYFLLIYQNVGGKYKHFKTTFLTQNGKVAFHWFLVVLTFAGQTSEALVLNLSLYYAGASLPRTTPTFSDTVPESCLSHFAILRPCHFCTE